MTIRILAFISILASGCQSSCKRDSPDPPISLHTVVEQHSQLYWASCIPSSVEIILKFCGKVNSDFYDLQLRWQGRSDGTFADFDGRTVKGLTFTHRFKEPRSGSFPIDSLFKTIDSELLAGRKVMVSLLSGPGLWHMYIVDSMTENGDYICYSRAFGQEKVLEIRDTKQQIRNISGTDILTYTVEPSR